MKKTFAFILFLVSAWSAQAQRANTSDSTFSQVELKSLVSQIQTGKMPCELGQSVTLTVDSKSANQFILQFKKESFHLTPVKTTTGAIRLEDDAKGAVWIQLPNKSMLMNNKLGQRLADECKSSQQVAISQALRFSPPTNLLTPDSGVANK